MRGIVPDIVINQKKKVGFNAPIEDLIDTNDNQTLKIMSDGPIWDIVNRELFKDFLINKNLPNSLSKFLFSFFDIKVFRRICLNIVIHVFYHTEPNLSINKDGICSACLQTQN